MIATGKRKRGGGPPKRGNGLSGGPHTVEMRPPDSLRPFDKNPQQHPPEQIAQLIDSIKEFGFTVPVLCDEDYMVLAGHGRQMAAVEMKLPAIPVIRRYGLTPAQKRAYVMADNKIGRNADFDWQLITEGLKDLKEEGFDLDLTGFRDFEYEPLLQAKWTPPMPKEEKNRGTALVSVTGDQLAIINQAWERMKEKENAKEMTVGRCMELLAADYLAGS
jgi:hypothetical protein